MTGAIPDLPAILERSPVRVVFAPGALARIGALAREEGAKHVLLVSDPGIAAIGYVDRAAESLRSAGLEVTSFDGTHENPTTREVEVGVEIARAASVDFIAGLGGGSAMDCAKGVNLILTNGGDVADYWGEDKVIRPLLPMILIPTTAGTGSEAQSFALITDPVTHQKMACGDRRPPREGGLRPRVAILDPDLTLTQPPGVAAAAGIDAIAHAVETTATTRRNGVSLEFSRLAWQRLSGAYETAVRDPRDDGARRDMLLGAHLAGAAIEFSMLGAVHACANPLTARFGIVHGQAVGLMLPHVVRFNAANGHNPYVLLDADAERLAACIERFLVAGRLPRRLADCGVRENDLSDVAALAAKQWTATFNPRPVGDAELLAIYRAAF